MSDPARLAEAQVQLWQDSVALWQSTLQRMLGQEAPPVIEPERGDRRFKDQAWSEDLLFDYVKQSYLLSARWLRGLVKDVPGLERPDQDKVDFFTRQFVSAVAPSNFVLTNPAVLRKAKETGGQNLVDGLQHLLADLERGKGRLQISMSRRGRLRGRQERRDLARQGRVPERADPADPVRAQRPGRSTGGRS